jgi:hypothetical protein
VIEMTFGKLLYCDIEGYKKAEEWRKDNAAFRFKISHALYALAVALGITMYEIKLWQELSRPPDFMETYFTPFVILLSFLFGLALMYTHVMLNKPFRPVRVYERGIKFTEFYVKYGYIYIHRHFDILFNELQEVKIWGNGFMFTKKDGSWCVLVEYFLSDKKKFTEILYQQLKKHNIKLLEQKGYGKQWVEYGLTIKDLKKLIESEMKSRKR